MMYRALGRLWREGVFTQLGTYAEGRDMRRDPYRRSASWYDALVEPLVSVLRDIGMKMYPPGEGMLVLDVGCGTGTHVDLYREAGCQPFGIDASPSMLQIARGKTGTSANLCRGDAAEMPYRDQAFDLVVVFLTLHEMPASIRSAVINESKRVLQGNGRILLVDYHPGPIRFPKGWLYRIVITGYEVAAGREHLANYRDFMRGGGLSRMAAEHQLAVESEKVVSGGNVRLLVLSLA